MSNEVALKNALRVIILSSNDKVISEFGMKVLKETKDEIVKHLEQTCWGEDELDLENNIRSILIENHKIKSK